MHLDRRRRISASAGSSFPASFSSSYLAIFSYTFFVACAIARDDGADGGDGDADSAEAVATTSSHYEPARPTYDRPLVKLATPMAAAAVAAAVTSI